MVPTTYVGIFLSLSSPLYNSFNVSIVKNLMAWFEPCFNIVGVRPLYIPCRPKIYFLQLTYSNLLIYANFTVFFNYQRNSMDESFIFRICTALIVNKPHFNCFHWCDSKNSFHYSSSESTKQFTKRTQGTLFIFGHVFERFKWTKPTKISSIVKLFIGDIPCFFSLEVFNWNVD